MKLLHPINDLNLIYEIADLIIKNNSFLTDNTLSGKLSTSLALIYASSVLESDNIFDLGFEVLDYSINKELLINIEKSSFGFIDGIIGIGWALQELIEHEYISMEIDDINEIIDNRLRPYFESFKDSKHDFVTLLVTKLYLEKRIAVNSKNMDFLFKSLKVCHDNIKRLSLEKDVNFLNELALSLIMQITKSDLQDRFSNKEECAGSMHSIPKKNTRHPALELSNLIKNLSGDKRKIYTLYIDSFNSKEQTLRTEKIRILFANVIGEESINSFDDKFVVLNKLAFLSLQPDSEFMKLYWLCSIFEDLKRSNITLSQHTT